MNIEFIVLLLIVVGGFVGLFWALMRRGKGNAGEQNLFLMLQNQINEVTRTLDERLHESTRLMQSHSVSSNKTLQEVHDRMARVEETQRQVAGFAQQLQNLQDILKNPKQRGIFGEYYLEALLKNAFHPKQYQMQYAFKDGQIVDAALFVGDKIIPIDSKFSLENYNRIVEESDPNRREELEKQFKQDLKNRIDETAKYIRPEERTLEFAFMFIPAEGIYYDLLVNQVGAIKVNTRDLLDYAINEKHVHIVSPTTFYVTLQSLWQGMRAYQIQESTKDILKNVATLGKHLAAYEDYFKKIGTHLGTTVNMYNHASKELGKIDKDVLRLTGESIKVDVTLLETPQKEDEG